MIDSILKFINTTEGYKTAIKNYHWASPNMSTHQLFDEIASAVSDIQDEVSEQAQGLEGQFDKNTLKPIPYDMKDEKTFLNDLSETAKELYNSVKDDDKYIGIASELESFIGVIDKQKYLLGLALHDSKRIKMTQEELKEFLYRSVKQVLKEAQSRQSHGMSVLVNGVEQMNAGMHELINEGHISSSDKKLHALNEHIQQIKRILTEI
jgi:DNA-binding ferritin-like protein